MLERKCVRYANFPDTTNGFIGFYEFKESGKAIYIKSLFFYLYTDNSYVWWIFYRNINVHPNIFFK